MTDVAIIDTLKTCRSGRNCMATESFPSFPSERNDVCRSGCKQQDIQENWTVYSIGGGALVKTTAIRQLKVLKYMG